jgi:hypothetical protein
MSRSSIANNLTDQLRQHIGKGEGTVQVDTDDVRVRVDVEQSERYAVGVRGITVTPAQPVTNINEAAERVVEHTQALGDPLSVVEYDSQAGRAIVRSAEPQHDEAGVIYWEADVRSDETTLRRYRKDHSLPEREVVTEPLPHAVAGRIAEQLTEAVTQT